jgi:hypothetical protein
VPKTRSELGRLVAIYAISAAYQQRAVFVSVLSFVFFVAMMIGFYVRENIGYFILASAFMVLYMVMMFSWLWARRNVVEVFEGGFKYRSNDVSWDQIDNISDDAKVLLKDGGTISLPEALEGSRQLIASIRGHLSGSTDDLV